MTAAALLASLRGRGLSVTADGEDVLVEGPEALLTDEVIAEVRRLKAGILQTLRRAEPPLRLVLVRHRHRCRCGREFACTAPSCAGKDIICVCCTLDDRRQGQQGGAR